jgi:hypothetical protein
MISLSLSLSLSLSPSFVLLFNFAHDSPPCFYGDSFPWNYHPVLSTTRIKIYTLPPIPVYTGLYFDFSLPPAVFVYFRICQSFPAFVCSMLSCGQSMYELAIFFYTRLISDTQPIFHSHRHHPTCLFYSEISSSTSTRLGST